MNPRQSKTSDPARSPGSKTAAILWTVSGVLFLALLFARGVFPEYLWLTILVGVALLAALVGLIFEYRSALSGRTGMFGLQSTMVSVLSILIVFVVNYLASQHPFKLDLTKNKIHTLSDQTIKVVKDLKSPVKAALFANPGKKEEFSALLENFRRLNPKFEVEYVNPDKEPTRTKQAGIKKQGTLQLVFGTKENKVEEPNEEKLTNALIKLLKDKSQILCNITGHGEKSFESGEAEGYAQMKKEFSNQAYEVKELNLMQETRIPETCNAIAILGPNKAFFDPEIKAIQEYLAGGGHAMIALDLNIKGGADFGQELFPVLASWNVKPGVALVIDPLSRMLGVDAAVPILASFSKEHAITKDFQANCYFPFMRPLEILPGAPAGLNVSWIGQTTPKSWGETDMAELRSGQVKPDQGKDKMGPLNAAIAVEGKQKDSKAARNTRLVVFGTSAFGTNNYSRFGGNLDFFMNSASWLMEDESLISIRSKEDGPGKIELSQKAGNVVFLVTVVIAPLLTSAGGIWLWNRRRKL